jgi:DNA end-binding protein Ku
LNRQTGNRLKQLLVDSETEEPVHKEDIVDSKSGHFEPEKFVDHYETALVSLLKAKQAGRVIEAPKEEAAPRRVVNLMDALRASITADAQKKPAVASAKSRKPAKRKASG